MTRDDDRVLQLASRLTDFLPSRPRCRDCADHDGRCQGNGQACDIRQRVLERIAAIPGLSGLLAGTHVVVPREQMPDMIREECAKVAEDWRPVGLYVLPHAGAQIAAAIRAMGDVE